MAARRLLVRFPTVPIIALLLCTLFLLVQFRQQPRAAGFRRPDATSAPPAVEIVVASLRREDTSWVRQHLPGWAHSIYITDDPSAALTVPKNKGREAMVYLTHLIDRYDTIANTTVFVHASRFAWHNDDPDYDSVPTLRRLSLAYVQASGYVNLRCVWVLGCPSEIRPHDDALDFGPEAIEPPSTKSVFKVAFQELMPGVEVPEVVGVSCCSQFAVTREAIHRRPKDDFIRWRDWLLETRLDDDVSGRVLEYTWHMIFGKPAVHCPSARECYCNLFGLCDLDCGEGQCDGRYTLPGSSILPSGWPEVGWSGEHRNFSGPL